jgi:hypothetical protein
MATFYEELLSNKDILDNVVYDWLGTKDLVAFDSAVVGADRRAQFRKSMQSVRYRVPFENNLELWWKNHKHILEWFIARKMYNSEGIWHVNQKLWEVLISDSKYDELLKSMRGIRFENFSSESGLFGLEKCVNLRRLEICNLLQVKSGVSPLNLPNLRQLYLQNCLMNSDLLNLLSNLPSLKFVQFHHDRYQPVSADAAHAFIGHVETVRVIGDMDGFLTNLVQKPNQWRHVFIDKMHKAETTPQDLHEFLKCVPEIRELQVERMRLHISSFFKCLAKYNTHLRRLHLNHIRSVETPSTFPEDAPTGCSFSSLQISTLLQSTNDSVLKILNLCANSVSDLQLSFCSRLDDAGYREIAQILPGLRSIEIDEKRELFEGNEHAGRVQKVSAEFSAIPKVKISLWPEWKSEKEKEMFPEQREVVFEKI